MQLTPIGFPARSLVACLSVAYALVLHAEQPFANADFEHGTFEGWEVHAGWTLRAGMHFPPNLGMGHQARGDIQMPALVGYFSAGSHDARERLARFYTGKDISVFPKTLVSARFEVTRAWLTFMMTGTLFKDRNLIGVDFDGDHLPEVRLTETERQRVRKLLPEAAVFSLDLRKHVGRTGQFVVQVHGEAVSIDRLSLEDEPVAPISAIDIEQQGRRATLAVRLVNPYEETCRAALAITVLDFYGSAVLSADRDLRVAAGQSSTVEADFPVVLGPDYRVTVQLANPSGAVFQIARRRWTAERLSAGRPAVLIDDGWQSTFSDDEKRGLPASSAKWSDESPVKPSGTFEYRSGQWKKHQKHAQVWYRRNLEWSVDGDGSLVAAGRTAGSGQKTPARAFLRLKGGGDGLMTVFVNGHEGATQSIYRYHDVSFDLSSGLRKGRNEIILRFRNPDRYLRGPDQQFTVPVRKYWGIPMGLFGHVYVEGRGAAHLDHVLIDPSVRQSALALRMAVRNVGPAPTEARIDARVFAADGREVLAFDPIDAKIDASGLTVVRATKQWDRPILWQLEDPRLLRLRVTVAANGKTDVTDTRFGFRELWTDGRHLLLNGHRLTIFDGTMYPPEEYPFLKQVLGMNANRAPLISFYSVVAGDEEGFLTRAINEDHHVPKTKDVAPDYWARHCDVQMARVRYFYNNPCVWMWVVGNELGGAGYLREPLVGTFRPLYTKLIERIQAIDPMRDVTSDGDLDFFGASKIWNVHYPHEYGRSYGLPNQAYFVEAGTQLMDWFPHPNYEGRKPVFFGEAFSGGNMGPDWLAPFGGDRVYRSPWGLFDTWAGWTILRMRAYRDQHVVGFEPFEPFAAVRDFFPVDVYPKEYGRSFYGGTKLKRTVRVFNGIQRPMALVLHWSLRPLTAGRASASSVAGEAPVRLDPGRDATLSVALDLLAVRERMDAQFTLWLTENGKPFPRCGQWRGVYSIFPKREITATVAVSGLSGRARQMLQSFGIECADVRGPAEVRRAQLLVTSGAIFESDRDAVWAWVRNGGHVLLLDQQDDIASFPLRLNRFSNTRAHPIAPAHPALAGVRPGDLSFWPDDHWVSHRSYTKPTDGEFLVLCETGDELGLRMTPLVELFEGRGSVMCCSLLLSEKHEREPLVGLLLNNIVRYAQRVGWAVPTITGNAVGAAHPTSRRVGALVSDTLMAKFRSGGWDVGDLAGADQPDLSAYDLLWIDAGLAQADLAALRSFAEKGGTVILSLLDPTVVKPWQPLVPFAFRLTASPRDLAYGGELKRKGDRALLDGISDYDLWWKRGSCPRGGPKGRITSIPVEFEISPRLKAAPVTEIVGSGAFLEAPVGKGRVLLSQIRWEEAFDKEQRSLRVFNTLLHNLAVPRSGLAPAQGESEFVPIRLPTNRALAPGVIAKVGDRVRRMPTGRAKLAGATFQTVSAKPELALLGAPKTLPDAPRRLTIPVDVRADRLWFWHSAAFGFIDYHHGKTVFEYRVNIRQDAKLRTAVVPVRYGQEVYEYIGAQPGTLDNATQVTQSANVGLSTYVMKWDNPHAGTSIESVEVVGVHDEVAAVLLGLSVEQRKPVAEAAVRRRTGPWSVADQHARFTQICDTGRVWAILGPFDNRPHPRGGFEASYPPEEKVDLAASYRGKDRMQIGWKRLVQPVLKKHSIHERMVFEELDVLPFRPTADREHWTAYAYTKIKSPAAQKVIIAFGSDDGAKMWVNGEKVFDEWVQRGAMLGQDLLTVDLRKGWNTVLVKIVNCFGSGGFAFDLKPYDEATVVEWQKGWATLAGRPSLDCELDAFASDGKSGAAQPQAANRALAGAMTLEMGGRQWTLDGVVRPSDAVTPGPEGLRLDFSRDPGVGFAVPIPQKGRAFDRGAFRMSFLVPKGGASRNIILFARNAGGANFGDVFVFLTNGQPSPAFGGQPEKPARPFDCVKVFVDRKQGYNATDVKIEDGIAEDVWHQLTMTWGDNARAPGVRLVLDGREVLAMPDYTGPVFCANVPLSLAVDGRKFGEGAIVIRDVHLSDRVDQ